MADLTPAERRLSVVLLDEYADRLSNDGCNDFDLREHMPDLAERNAFVEAYRRWNGDPEEYEAITDPNEEDYRLGNHCVTRLLARKLQGVAPNAARLVWLESSGGWVTAETPTHRLFIIRESTGGWWWALWRRSLGAMSSDPSHVTGRADTYEAAKAAVELAARGER